MSRSLVAVVTGFTFIASASIGTDFAMRAALPTLFAHDGRTTSVAILLLTIGYVGLYATVGCYLTARLAPRAPMRHALILGMLGLLVNVVGTWFTWNSAPAWYHVTSLLLVMLWAWIGGQMRVQEQRERPSRSAIV